MANRGKAASTSKRILGKSEFESGKLDSPNPLAQPPKCPECGSTKTWKDGLRYGRLDSLPIQRYLCRSCGRRFSNSKVKVNVLKQSRVLSDSIHDFGDLNLVNISVSKEGFQDSTFTVGKDIRSHDFPIVGKTINNFLPNSRERRVCVSESEAKNLVEVESRTEKRAAGATKLDEAIIKGKILEYTWQLKKQGYAETTITTRTIILKVLVKRGANLYDPESVKETIANQNWSEARKMNAVYTYDGFTKIIGKTWEPPSYIPTRVIPFIPTEAEIDALIAGCGRKIATKLQLLKETAMRSGEARRLMWTDIDMVNRVIRLNAPEKNSNPRIFKVSQKLISMLNSLSKTSLRVFGDTARMTDNKNYYCQRKRLAKKLDNSRLLQIGFHTLRNWKATKLYHQTKDILYVKEFLGHKSINSTLMYVQVAKVVFGGNSNDDFVCKVAETPEEVSELIEAGFDYVTDLEGKKFFRKRK